MNNFSTTPTDPYVIAKNRLLGKYGNVVGLSVGITMVVLQCLSLLAGTLLQGKITPLIDHWVQIVYSLLLTAIPSLLVLLLARRPLRSVARFAAPDKALWLPVTLAAQGAYMLAHYLTQAVSIGNYEAMVGELPADSPYIVILTLIVYAAVPALCEELLVRGVLMGVLRPLGDGFAIVASAAVFGIMHGNLMQAPSAFAAGLLFGYVAVKTGSLWPGIIAHFINNFISTAVQYANQIYGEGVGLALNYTAFLLMLLGGIIGVYMLAAKHPRFFESIRKDDRVEGVQYSRFYRSAGMIVLYVVCGLLAIRYLIVYGI